MKKKIINAALVVPNKIVEGRTVEIEQGVITAISSSDSDNKDASKAEVIDAKGLIITPGLIDIHIHGCAGADTMDASLEALSAISSHLHQSWRHLFLCDNRYQQPGEFADRYGGNFRLIRNRSPARGYWARM